MSPDFCLPTQKTHYREVQDFQLRPFGSEGEAVPNDPSEYSCGSTVRDGTNDHDLQTIEISDESDLDDWTEADDLGMFYGSSTPIGSEGEYENFQRPQAGLDWMSIISRIHHVNMGRRGRKEDYHYMMA